MKYELFARLSFAEQRSIYSKMTKHERAELMQGWKESAIIIGRVYDRFFKYESVAETGRKNEIQ